MTRNALMNKKKISTGIFWYWNADPTPGGIRRQLESIKEAGFECVYLHPMPDSFHKWNFFQGMYVSYLGKKYFELTAYTLEECKRLGLYLMLYDEAGWPSGGVLDRLVKKHPEDRAIYLVKDEAGNITKEYSDIPDLFAKKTTEHFIEMTHELYFRHFGSEFGKTIRGIFTDEPFWRCLSWENKVRYSPGMDKLLKERYDRSFEKDILPFLWHGTRELPGAPEARKIYLEVCTELFAVNYSEVLGKWCKAHNIDLEGHLNGEDEYFISGDQGGFTRRLDGFQVPGVDTIWRQIYPGGDHGSFARFASSAAIRNNRKETLCECFNVYTYFITPQVMSHVGNELLVKGINRILPMPFLYSDRGQRKICCSTDFSPRNPVWSAFPALNSFWKWAGNFDAGALKPAVWVWEHIEHPVHDLDKPPPEKHLAHARKVNEICRKLDEAGIFYRFAEKRDLSNRERPELLICPSSTPLEGFEDFPRVEYDVPADIRNYAVVREKGESGCYLLPVKRPEGEALMLFNPGAEEKVFTFESEDHYGELLPPDPGYSIYAPVEYSGNLIKIPLAPGVLRILLKNGSAPALPCHGTAEEFTPAWSITKVEKMMMSLKGPTFFKKEKCSSPLPASGDYTELDKNFSGFLTLESSFNSSRSGRALLIFDNIEHGAILTVNGTAPVLRVSAPWIFDVTVRKGINKLKLRISSSAGNEFFRCFKEELEPAKWQNSYARRFCNFERNDKKCGVYGKIKLLYTK